MTPALSAEEWAKVPADWHCHHTQFGNFGGDHYLTPEQRAALAALCLHGRISWEMVDALREEAHWRQDQAVRDPAYAAGHQERAEVLTSIADLLESLLPPREP